MAMSDNRNDADFRGRHFAIGTNVIVTIVAVVAIAVFLQWGAFHKSTKFDLTDSGVNSLTPGTEKLLKSVDQNIRLTSLYFQTDLETEDQAKYRAKVGDLAALYQGANRSRISFDAFNPLQDHAKREQFIERLQNLEKFKNESEDHRAIIDKLRDELAGQIGSLLEAELAEIESLTVAAVDESEKADLGQVEAALRQWQEVMSLLLADVDEALSTPQPRYGTAVSRISREYGNLKRTLTDITKFAEQLIPQRPNMSADTASFLAGASDRYQDLMDALDDEEQKARDVPRLEFETILRQIGPTANALVVETEDDAKVLGFSDIWPPADANMPSSSAGFRHRLFKGEEKVTSTILQLTVKEKPAVVFVRYGGQPLFLRGFPGQQQAPGYSRIKELLENANFTVKEWDLSSTDTAPTFKDPQPSRKLYVVLRPVQPPMQQFQRQPVQQAPFGDSHMATLRTEMGDEARAIFLVGWMPGPFGAFPAPYEMASYLKDEWGVDVQSEVLVIHALMGKKPGEYSLSPRSLVTFDFSRSDHLLTTDLRGKPAMFPRITPIKLSAEPPEGVTVDKLLWCERTESSWGVKNIQAYIDKARRQARIVKEPDDSLGPFTFAVTAEKGDAKIVVISSTDCMNDDAMSPAMVLTSQGIAVRQRAPGNSTLFLNSLHWLNDSTEWMGLGQPANIGTIEIDEGPGLTFIRAFVGGVWPAFALIAGIASWWIRRR